MEISDMKKSELEQMVFALTQENAILKFRMHQFTENQVNFGDYICDWLEKHRYKWQETTYEGYYRVIHKHIAPYFRERKITLQSLKPSVIEEYYNFKTKEGLGGNTIKRHHANIRKCLKDAEKDEIINKNPALLADLPLQKQTTIDYYNKGALLILLKVTRSTILYPLILLAILGLRRSELLGVCWSRINFNAATLTVSSKVVPLNGESAAIKDILKNKSSNRVLTIPLFIQEELRIIYNRQVQNFKNNPNGYNTKYNDYVCVDNRGNLITPHRASDMMLRSVTRNNLPPITLKGLRHTCATLISRLGFNLKFIQDWLGHSTITMAANTYTHINQDDKISVSNAMQEQIFADFMRKEISWDNLSQL